MKLTRKELANLARALRRAVQWGDVIQAQLWLRRLSSYAPSRARKRVTSQVTKKL